MIQIGGLYFPDGETHFQVYGEGVVDYQRADREKAFEYVTNWELALDLGANVGIFSRHFAERFERVWAIEPLASNIECLRLNTPENVEIKPFAVGDRADTVEMYEVGGTTGGSFVIETGAVGDRARLKADRIRSVPMKRLDDLDIQSVGLIKLDIQGCELMALRGAEETLRRCRPVILIEEKAFGDNSTMDHVADHTAFLLSLGMTAREKVVADRVFVF